ncbi:TIGR02217 family protein [Aquicoccus sp. SCR17]|nr:TIGR02217 family protein [Carideicomes alvinocaridis]
MSFHETRFPPALSFGSAGGPERRTEIVPLASGYEERNTPWAHSRRRYDAGMGMRSLDDLAEVLAFFEARRGQLYGFRWKDWADYRSGQPSQEVRYEDQRIGTGDGFRTAFQLVKHYRSGEADYARPIAKPVAGTVVCGVQGDELREGVHFELDATTGIVTFARPPGEDMPVTAGFEFDVPVRFDTEAIQVSVATFQAGEVPSVPVVELRV